MNKSQNSHYCNSLYRYGLNYSEDIAVVYLMMIILPLIMYIPNLIKKMLDMLKQLN